MEEFSQQLGGNLWGGLMSPSSPAAKASGDTATVAMVAPHTRGASAFDKGHCIPSSSLLSNNNNSQNSPGASSSHFPPSDADAIKAKIISHPQYSSVLAAYIDCQKVGAPPEVVARLSAVAQEQRASLICRDAPTDPELDQFMEANREMLVKYKEELTRPLQEAMEFLRRVESQLNFLSLTHGSVRISSAVQSRGAPTAVCQKANYVHLYEENPLLHAKLICKSCVASGSFRMVLFLLMFLFFILCGFPIPHM